MLLHFLESDFWLVLGSMLWGEGAALPILAVVLENLVPKNLTTAYHANAALLFLVGIGI